MDDVVLHTCGPAELEARIKLAIGRLAARREADDPESHVIRSGEVVVDDATYTAKVGGRSLDLTFKEFELLKFLAQHPGRVFSRQQLLQEVWGYDYFGGTRTVDVHVRRLRAKLGPENETLIGTVRNVGYRFVLPGQGARRAGRAAPSDRRADAVTRGAATWRGSPRRSAAACAAAVRRRPTPLDEATWLALRAPRRATRSTLTVDADDGVRRSCVDRVAEPGRAPRRARGTRARRARCWPTRCRRHAGRR